MTNVAISSITYHNYRNFSHYTCSVNSGTNLIIGSNGTGKTNILESISLLSPGKGLKQSGFNELIKYSNSAWSVNYSLKSKLGIAEVLNSYNADDRNRKLSYNGSNITSSELPKLLNVIWVTPQMEGIFIGPSGIRRKFLDRVVYNFQPDHAKNLNKYDHFVRERKKTLADRNRQAENSWLTTLEYKIAEQALLITKARRLVVASMGKAISSLDTDFPKAGLYLLHTLKADSDEVFLEAYSGQLKENRTKDAYSGRTNFGVHKNDLEVIHTYKELPARLCSTGEQKAMLISLILASVSAVIENTGSLPILLLDELFVHLDNHRKNQLTDYILSTKLQTFITATDIIGIEKLADKSNIINL